ncbi:MAG: hypothetical protein K6G61_09550 [Solobacterium sp.]|nr:hypothetical protein [Solobacterium sp.]
MAEINFEAYAKKALAAVKESPAKLKEIVSSNEALKKVLGDDGKLSMDDLARIKDMIVNSAAGKAIFGDDGKFDKDDASRILSDAKAAGEGLLTKAKDIFGK